MMQPPPDPVPMDEESSQEPTQSTQQVDASQPADLSVDSHLWGYLLPCNPALFRIDFHRLRRTYSVGRNRDANGQGNDIVLPGMKISNFHCKISWDGREDKESAITIHDTSSNGTFINGERIGRGKHMILREGNEIAFGTATPQTANGGVEDYRFVYRHLAAGPPTEGLHAHYQLHNELGKGSFATVMKAMSRENGKWYAVKMIQASKLRSPGGSIDPSREGKSSHAFAREITILESLQHPNICQLKEVFFERFNINLVLEYVSGGDLLDYILKKDGLDEPESQHVTYQICDALAYIHSMGIAHRDLKPENVLLTEDVPPIVKVADFGLAKAIDSCTMLRTMCGTPCYLAPEVVNQVDNKGYDQVVDSWSVGVIVFSMLTSASPFINEDTDADVRARVASRDIDWECLQGRNISNEAVDFIERLLEKDPAQRMTLATARKHPWLAAQARANGLLAEERQRTVSPEPQENPELAEASMTSVRTGMDIDEDASQESQASTVEPAVPLASQPSTVGPIPGAFPGSQPRNGLKKQSSRGGPLQRRANVLSASQEQSQQRESSSPDEDQGEQGTRRKRKAFPDLGVLAPMHEEEGWEADAIPHNVAKRSRTAGATPAKRTRGANARTGAAQVNAEAEVRRSTRLQTPQRAARR